MKVYETNEVKKDDYYALQSMKYGQWMYCSSYTCVKGVDIPNILEEESKSVYADPSQKGEWRIVDVT
jgi:hypothetical protein